MARKRRANVNSLSHDSLKRSGGSRTKSVDHSFKLAINQICWARTSSKSAFWPAMVIDPRTVENQRTNRKLPVLYVVRYFDELQSITFVTSNSWIKSWVEGVNDGSIDGLQTKAFKKAVSLAREQLKVSSIKLLKVEHDHQVNQVDSGCIELQQTTDQQAASDQDASRYPSTPAAVQISPTDLNSGDAKNEQAQPLMKYRMETGRSLSNIKSTYQCPKCGQSMEHYQRHTVVVNGMRTVHGFWACSGWANQTCRFPLGERNFANYSTLRTMKEIAIGFLPPPPLPTATMIPSITTSTIDATSATTVKEDDYCSKGSVAVVSSRLPSTQTLESLAVVENRPMIEEVSVAQKPIVSAKTAIRKRQLIPFAVKNRANRPFDSWNSTNRLLKESDAFGLSASPPQPAPLNTSAKRPFQDPELNALVQRHLTLVRRRLAPLLQREAPCDMRQSHLASLGTSNSTNKSVINQQSSKANCTESSIPPTAITYRPSQNTQAPLTTALDPNNFGGWKTPTAPGTTKLMTNAPEVIESTQVSSPTGGDQGVDMADAGHYWEEDPSMTLSEYFGL